MDDFHDAFMRVKRQGIWPVSGGRRRQADWFVRAYDAASLELSKMGGYMEAPPAE